MEELGRNSSSSTLSASAVNKFKKELEKTGVVLTPELERVLRKCIDESYYEIHSSKPSSLTEDVGTTRPGFEQSAQASLPPLVVHLDYNCVMAMMINGKPEVVKNEKGSESTPAFAGFKDGKRFVYGTEAEAYRYCGEPGLSVSLQNFWWYYKPNRRTETVDLKEFGIFKLPRLFFMASFIRKLKITAEESQCNGGLCQVAILVIPTKTTSAKRLHLKEAARFAGFQDVYVISAEGLAAYYWFHKNETEKKQNKYSEDFVIVELMDTAVLYKKSFEAGTDGKKNLVVTPVVLLNGFKFGRFYYTTCKDEFVEMIRNRFKLDENAVIPIVGAGTRFWLSSCSPQGLDNNKMEKVDYNDNSDGFGHCAVKGAALLSGNPENIGRQVRNLMGSVKIEYDNYRLPSSDFMITRPDRILPETFAQRTFTIKHNMTKYWISQYNEAIGCLVINGVKSGSELQVTYELSWEGIWKVIGVSAKNPSEDDQDYKAVSWEWLISNKVSDLQIGSSSYEKCKSLLLKLAPSPSQAKVASTEDDSSGGLPLNTLDGDEDTSASVCSSLDENGKMLATKSRVSQPNDKNRCEDLDKPSQVKGTSSGLAKVGIPAAGLENSQDQSVGLGSSTIVSGDGNGMQEKKRRRKGRVLCTNDIIVNPHKKKIKLESDWVDPVVKIEQDSVDDLEKDGNGQWINFEEHEIEIEENGVKTEVEEEENVTD